MPGSSEQHDNQSVAISVDFYDPDEKAKLLKYPRAAEIAALVGSTINVPLAEFLTYYLFYKKRPGRDGYRNYKELSQKTGKALSELEDFVDVGAGTVRLIEGSGSTIPSLTERIGESVGVSVVNRIHGLHEADWNKIPTHAGRKGFPTFDYATSAPESASDGTAIVQVETKGASGEDPDKLMASVRTQIANARKKKTEVAKLELSGSYRYPASVRYATVTAVGIDGPAKCWLLDPPPETLADPVATKIINRIHFLTDCLSFISPRSQLAAAAHTRLRALMELGNPFDLSGVPLIKGNGRPFELITFEPIARRHGFFRNMSHVVDGPAGGIASQLPDGDILFIGIREDLVRMILEQDFEQIVRYKFPAASMYKEVECIFSRGRGRGLRLPEGMTTDTSDTQVKFVLSGTIHYSPGGMVFGVLPLARSAKKTARH